MKKLLVILTAMVMILALSACSSVKKESKTDSQGGSQTDITKDTSAQGQAQQEGQTSNNPPANQPEPAKAGVKKAIIEMDKGKIVIELFEKDAPETVKNFENLINQGFYNGLTFHRLVPGFIVQGGDPDGNGTGGPGYTIPDEVNSRKHLRGTVAMAKTEAPNSGGSQFYICFKPLPKLDGRYTIFGQVIEGMDVVDNIQIGDVMNNVKVVTE